LELMPSRRAVRATRQAPTLEVSLAATVFSECAMAYLSVTWPLYLWL